jgi:hypothetical protein
MPEQEKAINDAGKSASADSFQLDTVVRCAECKYWAEKRYEWDRHSRPCHNYDGRFFVGGGDNNDGLYTEPNFGCVDGVRRT